MHQPARPPRPRTPQAACNGPYDGKWSKTMVGYGPEDRNFVLELAYNYGVKAYAYGNGLGYVKILSKSAFRTAQDLVRRAR